MSTIIMPKAKESSVRVIMSAQTRNIGSGRGSIFDDPLGEPEVTKDSVKFIRALKFTSKGNSSIDLYTNGGDRPNLEYSFDGNKWKIFDDQLRLGDSQSVYIRGNNPEGFSSYSNYNRFVMTGSISVTGNIMHLLSYEEDLLTIPTNECFRGLFSYCTGLTTAPELPAITLTDSCYSSMFMGCSNLLKAPELPATTLANSCYSSMFSGCTSLTIAPKLPATKLARDCYTAMFIWCSNLIETFELPALVLEPWCYSDMFMGCSNLIKAPELPATTLAEYCYSNMFAGCTGLKKAPNILPATELYDECYSNMFNGCSSLVIAPELPANELVNSCYNRMFINCSSLSYIKCMATDISANNCLYQWVDNVAPKGTFVKDPFMESWLIDSPHGIPLGWTVKDYIECEDPVVFTAIEDNSELKLSRISPNQKLWYNKDNNNEWSKFNTNVIIGLNNDEIVYISGKLNNNNDSSRYTQFSTRSGKFNVSGNINSLWDYNDLNVALKRYCGCNLFNYCTRLVDASKLKLPANILTTNCYKSMFYNCTNLTGIPKLPATSLMPDCYREMFYNCTSLTEVPSNLLPATNLSSATQCYAGMFRGCTNLKNVPELPSNNLRYASQCYSLMFEGCISLTEVPRNLLPATELSVQCYWSMFSGCTNLTNAPELPSTTLATECYTSMFYKCTSLTRAPELPATILVDSCYSTMFAHCSSLSYIKCLATDISANRCLNSWTNEVATSGIFVKNPTMESWTYDSPHGIPSGWIIEDAVIEE